MRGLWAAAMLLRRLRTEVGAIVLLFVLVAGTSFLFAAGPRLLSRVFDDALRYAVSEATPAQRDLTLALDSTIAPGSRGGVAGVRALGDELAQRIPASIAALVSGRSLQVTTPRFFVSDPPSYETHLSLRYQDGVTEATRLVAGRWPVDLGAPLRRAAVGSTTGGSANGTTPQPVLIEAALSTDEASAIGVRLGDRLAVTMDGSDPLLAGTFFKIVPAEIEIVGLFEPLDPGAGEWSGDSSLLEVIQAGTLQHPVAYATAYVPAETYPSLQSSGMPFHDLWRFIVDPQRLDAGGLPALQADLRHLDVGSGPSGLASSVDVRTGLLAILDRYVAQRALTESVLSVAAVGPLGLAGGALGMAAILLVMRRRAMLALTRGRGASGPLVLGAQLWEAVLVAGSASLLGLMAATALIPARDSPLSPLLAVAVGGAAALLLLAATWPDARRPLGQLERDDPPIVRVAPRRLVIEATIVGTAVAAALLLRQRGLTIGGGTGVHSVDPLLAAVPVLAGLAAGIVVVRLYPVPIRALAWLAARRRDLVPVLGLRTIGRQPAAANLPLLVLLLTAAFGAFSSVIVSSVDRGQLVASYLDVGADFRIESTGLGPLAPGVDPAAVPGIEAVAAGIVERTAPFASVAGQWASIYLEAVDPRAYRQVAAGTAAEPSWPGDFVADPAGGDVGTATNPIPAIVSPRLPSGSASLAPGDTFQVRVEGVPLTLRLVERRDSFAGIGEPISFAIVPFTWVQAALGSAHVPPTVMWVRAPESAAGPLAAIVAGPASQAHVVSRYIVYGTLHDAPLETAVVGGFELALVLAGVYTALTIVGAVVLSAARRTQDLAYLRTLGLTASQALALTVVEHGPPVLLALVPGIALGIGVASLVEPGLGLATFVGSSGVPLFVDWLGLGLLVGSLVAVVAAAVTAGTWVSRRVALADALRIGDD